MSGLLARRKGRHRRHGSLTGWSSLAEACRPIAKPLVDFAGRRRTPLALMPLAADELIPFGSAPRSHPYERTTS